ncbi:hypothetical protein IAQ61_011038 [Plenodomus lingam]|nr:hypothetical protein IAQ61_011038 [Plenodomus lingam]
MAALTSSAHPPAPHQQPTPPSSSHGKGGVWDFAVPAHGSRASEDEEPYMSGYTATSHGTRHAHTSQANGFAKPVRSPTWDSQDQYEYSQAKRVADGQDRMNGLHKKASGDVRARAVTSDQEGVQEYYKSHANATNKKTAKGKPKKKATRSTSADPSLSKAELDETNWIHRDKLKEIETRELEEAGFRVGRSSRSNSRSQSATRRPRDRTNSESTELTQMEDRAERRLVSPIPAEDDEAFEQYNAWNATNHGQGIHEFQPASPKTSHNGRPSTSRIPLPKTSGIPVPALLADRDAPLTRSRTGSMNWSGDAIATNGARMRSGSVGSQALLDDAEEGRQTTPPYVGHARNLSAGSNSPKSPQKSPVKAKNPTKANTTTGTRKTSAQKTQPKRVTSGAASGKRPGTSGGAVSRPTTSHRPEGEAPWIATMYKPDPRLPPDQQIIPTHAKRMQQQQWENEGRVGSMYGKDFRLLDDSPPDKRLSQIDPIQLEKARENEAWPLSSPEKQEQPLERQESNTAKSPVAEQGGYKLTPTIAQGARSPSPKMAPPIEPAERRSSGVTRIPEPIEEAKEKKGCGCIVM